MFIVYCRAVPIRYCTYAVSMDRQQQQQQQQQQQHSRKKRKVHQYQYYYHSYNLSHLAGMQRMVIFCTRISTINTLCLWLDNSFNNNNNRERKGRNGTIIFIRIIPLDNTDSNIIANCYQVLYTHLTMANNSYSGIN